MKLPILSIAYVSVILIGTACKPSAKTQKPAEPAYGITGEKGQFSLYLTDFPLKDTTISKVLVTFSHIEIHSDIAGWQTIADFRPAGKSVDLLLLQNGQTDLLTQLSLAPANYSQIRLHVFADNKVEVNEGSGITLKPLKIPSGAETGIKLVHAFKIEKTGSTSIVVDFDAQKSVTITGSKKSGYNYHLKPTLKIVSASTQAGASQRISATTGGIITIPNKASLSIPAHAIKDDTTFEIVPITVPLANFDNSDHLPYYYTINPAGTQFTVPATVTLYHTATDVAAAGISEWDLEILKSPDALRGPWQPQRSSVDLIGHFVTAEITSLSSFNSGGGPPTRPRVQPGFVYLMTDNAPGPNTTCGGVPVLVTALVRDEGADITNPALIVAVELTYGPTGGPYKMIAMPFNNQLPAYNYSVAIPLADARNFLATGTTDSMSFSIRVQDPSGNVRYAPGGATQSFHVENFAGDLDGDGINDRWEWETSLAAGQPFSVCSTSMLPGADLDGDGYTNLQEFAANTNPFNAASFPCGNYGTSLWNQVNWCN